MNEVIVRGRGRFPFNSNNLPNKTFSILPSNITSDFSMLFYRTIRYYIRYSVMFLTPLRFSFKISFNPIVTVSENERTTGKGLI